MSDEEFKEQRNAYIVKNIEIPKMMQYQANRFWSEISLHQFCFDRRMIVIIIKT